MRFLYSLLFYCALPFIFLRLWFKGRKTAGYRQRWKERLGFVDALNQPVIWLHAVSLGELMAARPLISSLEKWFPEYIIFITNMTVTGSTLAAQLANNKIRYAYVPYDIPAAVNRFLNRIKPKIAIIMETELWPNLIHCTSKRGIPILIANARLSERSSKGYARMKAITKPMLEKIDCIAAQTQQDAQRFVHVGAKPEKTLVFGNIKFDVVVPELLIAKGRALRETFGKERPVLIAASTHAGEEEMVLSAFAKLLEKYSDALLILVPRHPERFDAVADLCQRSGFEFIRRSQNIETTNNISIFLGDSMGELFLYYAAADIAFVGGSFIALGGHNLLEPAALQLPVLAGPHLFNFTEIANLLLQAQALKVLQNEQDLLEVWLQLLEDSKYRMEMGKRGLEVIKQNQGAVEKHLAFIKQKLAGQEY